MGRIKNLATVTTIRANCKDWLNLVATLTFSINLHDNGSHYFHLGSLLIYGVLEIVWSSSMTTAVKCACPKCTCSVTEESAIVLQGKFFCSEACSAGHPNNEPCHGEGACGCKCGE